LAICNTCVFCLKKDDKPYRCKHKSCGCFLEKKAWRKAERCPMGFWREYE